MAPNGIAEKPITVQARDTLSSSAGQSCV